MQTRLNNVVEQEPTIVPLRRRRLRLHGRVAGSAQTTITNNNVPALPISGGTTVTPGGSATLTVTANQAPLQDMQVSLDVSGSATPGTDYNPVNPILTIAAGTTSASVTIQTINNNVIQPNKYIVVSLAPSPTSYSVAHRGPP